MPMWAQLTRPRRRRLKELRDPAYTLEESQRAAGLGVDNKQRGVEEVVRRLDGMDAGGSGDQAMDGSATEAPQAQAQAQEGRA